MDGILVLAKPMGPTSHDMVALVRRLSGTRRVGHGGTLDPFASGVLPIFLGKATRLVEFHLGATKRYRATVCFGAASTTDDLEGDLSPVEGSAPTREAVEAALAGFRGEIQQRPPAFSAIKVAGRRAYAMARAGETPELAPRTITIHDLTLLAWDGVDPVRPMATLDVICSAGTYIRAIARDLGESVGSGAYLGALVRTASGAFTLDDAIPVDAIREAAAAGETALAKLLRPIDEGLPAMPEVRLVPAEREAVLKGQFVRPASGLPTGVAQEAMVRLVDGAGTLVALGHVRGNRIAPEKVLVDVGTAAAPASRPARPVHAAASRTASGPTQASAMRVVIGIDALTAGDGPLFLVVGVFDGLHRGHLYLLDHLRAEAARRGARSGVITFDAHPDEILTGAAPPILCDPDERLALLAAAGVDVTIVQHFDRALRMTQYQEFIAMITGRTSLAGLLMTPDAAFGHERRGTPDALAELGRTEGFEVVVVPPFQIAGRDIRSADIRALIAVGDLAGAGSLLGRAYSVVGRRSSALEGSLARPGLEVLTFPMPVALPPAGTVAGFASADAVGAEAIPVEVVIPEDAAWIEVRSTAGVGLPSSARIRVTFSA